MNDCFTLTRREKKEMKREAREGTGIKRMRAAYKRLMKKGTEVRQEYPDLKRAFHALQ